MYSEVVYFAGLCNLLGPRILERRRNPIVHKIKSIVQVGTGVGLEPPEIKLLEKDVSLVERPGFQPVREMARHDFEVLQMLNTILNQAPTWVDQPPLLIKRVLAMVQ